MKLEVKMVEFKMGKCWTYVGSLARLRNKHTLSMEPFSSKSDLKNLAVSMLTSKRERDHESVINTSLRSSRNWKLTKSA